MIIFVRWVPIFLLGLGDTTFLPISDICNRYETDLRTLITLNNQLFLLKNHKRIFKKNKSYNIMTY